MKNKDELKKIGRSISFYRKVSALSQSELAKRVGVSLRTIQRAENGDTELRINAFMSICKQLEVSMDEVVNGTSENNSF